MLSFKKIFIVCVFLVPVLGATAGYAQTDSAANAQKAPVPIYTGTDENPEPLGGVAGYNSYIAKHVVYPKEAIKANAQGTVYVSMVITKTGEIKDVRIKKDGVGYGCGEEAVRVVKSMPPWKPGKMDGKPIEVRYTVPVKFVLK